MKQLKHIIPVVVIAVSGVAYSGSLRADDQQTRPNETQNPANDRSTDPTTKSTDDRGSNPTTTMKASDSPTIMNKASGLLGMVIRSPEQNRLGKIEDIVFDPRSSKVAYVVMGSGGVLGIGEKQVAVPLSAFSPNQDTFALLLNTTPQRMEPAVGLRGGHWPSIDNPVWGAEPFWTAPQGKANDATGNTSNPGTSDTGKSTGRSAGTAIPPGSATPNPSDIGTGTVNANNNITATEGATPARTGSNVGTDQTTVDITKDQTSSASDRSKNYSGTDRNRDNRMANSAMGQEPSKLNRMKYVCGSTVKDSSGNSLGKIVDLVLDFQSEKVAYSVFSPEGGAATVTGRKLLAIPLSAYTQDPGSEHFILNSSKEKLDSAQGLSIDTWPSLTKPEWGGSQVWQQEPNAGTPADTTGTPAGTPVPSDHQPLQPKGDQ